MYSSLSLDLHCPLPCKMNWILDLFSPCFFNLFLNYCLDVVPTFLLMVYFPLAMSSNAMIISSCIFPVCIYFQLPFWLLFTQSFMLVLLFHCILTSILTFPLISVAGSSSLALIYSDSLDAPGGNLSIHFRILSIIVKCENFKTKVKVTIFCISFGILYF